MPRSPSDGGVKSLVRHAVALERRILAVFDHRHAEHPGVLERPAQQQRGRHGMAVVGDGDAAGLLQLGDVGQQLALRPLRDRADRIDPGECLGRLRQDLAR